MRQILVGALAALMLFAGCKSKDSSSGTKPAPSASAEKKGALEVKWVGKRFSVQGERARGNFVVPSRPEDSGGLTVRSYLYDFPEGTKASFGGQTASVKEGKPLVQNADFTAQVAQLSLDDVQRKRVELDIPLTISYPGRGELKLKTPPLRIAHAVAHELTRAEKEPLKFPGEKAASGEPDTVAIIRVRSRSRRMRILGDGKTVADIDWVAIERTHGEPRKAECPRPGKKPRVLKLTDLEVAIFERQTGKPVESKVFVAKPQCQPVPQGQKGPASQRDEIEEWLRKKLGLPDPPPSAQGPKGRSAPPPGIRPSLGKPGTGTPAKPAAPTGPAAPAKPAAPAPAKPAAPPAAPAGQ